MDNLIINNLPYEMRVEISKHLNLVDIIHFYGTSSDHQTLYHDEVLWKNIYMREYMTSNMVEFKIHWSSLVKLCYALNRLINDWPLLNMDIKMLYQQNKLDLHYKQLTILPPEMGQLKNLKYLYLYHNQLTRVPPEIGQLKNLTRLYLNDNKLTNLPSAEKLKNLKSLGPFDDQLSADICNIC